MGQTANIIRRIYRILADMEEMRTDEQRLIGHMLPIGMISEGGTSEKIRGRGRIVNIHRWWAAKPTTVSRAIAYASLVNPPMSDHQDMIADMCDFANTTDPNKPFIRDRARDRIREIWGDVTPKILDPYGGSGSLSFAAAWLGCESYSMDYNPVAVMIQKCVLEYPAKYGRKLYDDVEKISKEVGDMIQDGVAEFYPALDGERAGWIGMDDINNIKGYSHYAYRWCRTIPCTCGAIIPLVQSYYLCNRKNKKYFLYPVAHDDKSVTFKIAGGPKNTKKLPPGQISKRVAKCVVCGLTYTNREIRKLFNEGKGGEQMLAAVYNRPMKLGRFYFEVGQGFDDISLYERCKDELAKRRSAFRDKYGIDPIPTNIISTPDSKEYAFGGSYWMSSVVVTHGYTRWGHLFNDRQLLCLVTIMDILRQTETRIIAEYGKEYGTVLMAYLAFVFNKTLEKYCRTTTWFAAREFVIPCFSQQVVKPTWDYAEAEPVQIWDNVTISVLDGLNAALSAADGGKYHVQMGSATSLPYEDNYFDAICTDPPYYNSMQYSKTADFFYVWLKKTIGHLPEYQGMFRGILSPKKDEVVQTSNDVIGFSGTNDIVRDQEGYQQLMTKSLKEMYRVIKPDGIMTLIYAHKTTAGWETLIQSMLDSGFVITAAWPIDTEHKARIAAQNTASLASSIYMVARKWKKEPSRYYRDVKPELQEYVASKLDYFMKEGIIGGDFYISAIGTSCAVFSKYESVLRDDTGEPVTVREILDEIRGLCSNHIVKMLIADDNVGSIDAMSKIYMTWRWAYGDRGVSYDEARKLFTGVGLDIGDYMGDIVKKWGVIIHMLDSKGRKSIRTHKNTIDILHKALQLWREQRTDEMQKLLESTGNYNNSRFFAICQAIIEAGAHNPISHAETDEKREIEAFLAGRRAKADGIHEKPTLDSHA